MGRKTKTNAEFIKDAVALHGNKYDYCLVEYTGSFNKIDITCPKHGVFTIRPSDHTNKKKPVGCVECFRESRRKSKDIVIQEAITKHGNKYTYIDVYTQDWKTYVVFHCNKHNKTTTQVASDHIRGTGCQACGYESEHIGGRLQPEDILSRLNEIHNNYYKFGSLDNYKTNKDKIEVICPEHGLFKSTVAGLLRGEGCTKCGGKSYCTVDEFIQLCINKYDNKYSYDKVSYVNNVTPVIITCPIHGDFEVKPRYFLAHENSCKDCIGRRPTDRLTQDIVIERFIKIHGDTFDYTKTRYENAHSKITVTCKTHGDFQTTYKLHYIDKKGCGKCAYSLSGIRNRKSQEDFLEDLYSTYGNQYDFSKAQYVKSDEKVLGICSKHGEFWQTPNTLCSGTACPTCGHKRKNGSYNFKWLERNKERLLQEDNNIYLMHIPSFGSSIYKIGISVDVHKRIKSLSREIGSPLELVYFKTINTYSARHIEKFLIDLFEPLSVITPVKFGGHSEVFSLDKSHIQFIKDFLNEDFKEDWHVEVENGL